MLFAIGDYANISSDAWFLCTIVSGNLILKEHEAARWLTKEQLWLVDWLPADMGLIKKLEEVL